MEVTENPAADWRMAELARAIDEAQWLAWRIGMVEGPNSEALDLYVRLECARAELESLRPAQLGRDRDRQTGPGQLHRPHGP